MVSGIGTVLVAVIYDGEEIQVTQEMADAMDDLRRDQERQDKSDRRHLSDKECRECYIEDFMIAAPDSLENGLVHRELLARLHKAVSELPGVQRRRLVAYYFGGLTYRQIAGQEGKSDSAIRESINAALKKLKRVLSDTLSNGL